MADGNEIYPTKPKTQQLPEANQPSKFYSHFLYKAAFFTVFVVLIPLFPTEIINQSQNARSWELLQLIFVGIAVSYGLFSKKNDDDDDDDVEKDHHVSKIDNAQSYVSKLLQVSSVFDDESENDTVIDENKVQTWNSKYYRGEPVVVVAKESANVKESSGVSLAISQKPLLLPVRSLKQRVPEPNEVDLVNDSGGRSTFTRSGSSSGSKRFSSNLSIPKNGDFGGRSSEKLEEKTEDNNIVLRSPIPWRSRSGRREVEGNGDSHEFKLETRSVNPKAGKLEVEPNGDSPEFRPETRIPKSGSGVEVEENGDGPEFRSGMKSIRQRSGRMEGEENEDIPDLRSGMRFIRQRSGRMEAEENEDSPDLRSGMRSIRQRSGRMEVEENEDSPDLRSGMRSIRQRSGRTEVEVNGDSPEFRLETVSLRERSGRMEKEGNGGSPEFRSETRSLKPNRSFKNLPPQSLPSPKKLSNQASFPLEPQAKSSEDAVRKKKYSTPPPPPPPPPFPRKDTRRLTSSMTNSSVSSHKEFKRSVRSVSMDELSDSDENARKMYPGSESRGRVLYGGLPKSVRTFRSNESEVEQQRKSVDYDIKFSEEQSNEPFEKVLVETSDDDDSEIDNELDKLVRSPGKAEEAANGDEANEPGPDVDKKADEFIAKFREQIRLQRINSFRRSAADRSLKTSFPV